MKEFWWWFIGTVIIINTLQFLINKVKKVFKEYDNEQTNTLHKS